MLNDPCYDEIDSGIEINICLRIFSYIHSSPYFSGSTFNRNGSEDVCSGRLLIEKGNFIYEDDEYVPRYSSGRTSHRLGESGKNSPDRLSLSDMGKSFIGNAAIFTSTCSGKSYLSGTRSTYKSILHDATFTTSIFKSRPFIASYCIGLSGFESSLSHQEGDIVFIQDTALCEGGGWIIYYPPCGSHPTDDMIDRFEKLVAIMSFFTGRRNLSHIRISSNGSDCRIYLRSLPIDDEGGVALIECCSADSLIGSILSFCMKCSDTKIIITLQRAASWYSYKTFIQSDYIGKIVCLESIIAGLTRGMDGRKDVEEDILNEAISIVRDSGSANSDIIIDRLRIRFKENVHLWDKFKKACEIHSIRLVDVDESQFRKCLNYRGKIVHSGIHGPENSNGYDNLTDSYMLALNIICRIVLSVISYNGPYKYLYTEGGRWLTSSFLAKTWAASPRSHSRIGYPRTPGPDSMRHLVMRAVSSSAMLSMTFDCSLNDIHYLEGFPAREEDIIDSIQYLIAVGLLNSPGPVWDKLRYNYIDTSTLDYFTKFNSTMSDEGRRILAVATSKLEGMTMPHNVDNYEKSWSSAMLETAA